MVCPHNYLPSHHNTTATAATADAVCTGHFTWCGPPSVCSASCPGGMSYRVLPRGRRPCDTRRYGSLANSNPGVIGVQRVVYHHGDHVMRHCHHRRRPCRWGIHHLKSLWPKNIIDATVEHVLLIVLYDNNGHVVQIYKTHSYLFNTNSTHSDPSSKQRHRAAQIK